jgi:hypothetical protein
MKPNAKEWNWKKKSIKWRIQNKINNNKKNDDQYKKKMTWKFC